MKDHASTLSGKSGSMGGGKAAADTLTKLHEIHPLLSKFSLEAAAVILSTADLIQLQPA